MILEPGYQTIIGCARLGCRGGPVLTRGWPLPAAPRFQLPIGWSIG